MIITLPYKWVKIFGNLIVVTEDFSKDKNAKQQTDREEFIDSKVEWTLFESRGVERENKGPQ